MALYCALLLMLTMLWSTSGTETLYPSTEIKTYRCGMDEDCTIKCDARDACYHSEFFIHNHRVSLECTAIDSCIGITVISTNVTTLNITATASGSLSNSDVIIDSSNSNVYTFCDADGACAGAKFFYQNDGSVTHTCRGEGACAGAVIHSATIIEYHSNSYNDDRSTRVAPINIIWPTQTALIQQSKWIQYSLSTQVLFLPNTDVVPNITCFHGASCDDIAVQILYGTTFDQSCRYTHVSSNECFSAILAYEDDEYDANTFHHRYYSSLNTTQTLHFDRNTIMTIDPYLYTSIQFNSVQEDAHISMICIDCNYITFNFSSISSTAITVLDELYNCEILGPQTRFLFNYMPQSQLAGNVYHLETTDDVIFNGLQECASQTEDTSYIYLGNETDVEINDAIIRQSTWCCESDVAELDSESCEDVCEDGTIIYSSLGSEWEALEEHEWYMAFTEEDECIRFDSTPIASGNKDGLPIWGTALIIVGVCAVIVIIGWIVFRCKQVELEKKVTELPDSERQPGSVEVESFHRASTKNLDINEDGEDMNEQKEESMDGDMKEGSEEGNMVYNRQETDNHIAVSAIDANKADTSTHGGDGEGHDEVRQWLEETVKLSQYYDNFVNNGMNDLELIQNIDDKSDLEYLGITMKGHQIAIMKKIKELKAGNDQNMNESVENRKRAQITPYDSAAHLEVIGADDDNKDNDNQSMEQKEDVVLDNMLSEVLEMQKSDPDKIHQMNVDAAVDQKENVSDSDDSDHMYQDQK